MPPPRPAHNRVLTMLSGTLFKEQGAKRSALWEARKAVGDVHPPPYELG